MYIFFLSPLFREKYKPLPKIQVLSQFYLFYFTCIILKEYYLKNTDYPLEKDTKTTAKRWQLLTVFFLWGKKQQSDYKDDTVQPVHSVDQKLCIVLIQYMHFKLKSRWILTEVHVLAYYYRSTCISILLVVCAI